METLSAAQMAAGWPVQNGRVAQRQEVSPCVCKSEKSPLRILETDGILQSEIRFMSVLCDLFTATDSEASLLTLDDVPIQKFGGVDAKGLDPVPFATLHNILTGIDVQQAVLEQTLCVEITEFGPWVYRLPSSLCAALAGLSESESASVATQWAATEELKLASWRVSDAEFVLAQLIELCHRAASDNQSVFIWNAV
jgi:hypothetical protein